MRLLFCEKAERLFGLSGTELEKKIERFCTNSSEAEKRSRINSLPRLIGELERAGLGNLYVAAEYELPTGGRIDAVILGCGNNGRPAALVTELKQWSAGGTKYREDHGFPSIVVRADESYRAWHPVNQLAAYVESLVSNHSAVVNGEIDIFSCGYLHNFESSEKNFFASKMFSEMDISALFFKGEEEKFRSFLRSVFSDSADSSRARELFMNGEYVIAELGAEAINKIDKDSESILLWTDQSRIFDYVFPLLKMQKEGKLKQRHLIVISGAAGTGKTILGFKLLAEYIRLHKGDGEYFKKCKYALPQSRTIKQVLEGLFDGKARVPVIFLNQVRNQNELLVVDEAHRITNFDRNGEVFKSSGIVFVLQDDRQIVRGNEIGTVQNYKSFANKNNFMFTKFGLEYQKRSGFGSYVKKIDKLFYGDEYDGEDESGIDIRICGSLRELEALTEKAHEKTASVKYYAPYCWEWKSRSRPGAVDIEINDGGYEFKKQWNPMDNQYDWYRDCIDMVGCVYTAQGLDFDYVGLIWWDDLVWRKDHWEYRMEKVAKYDIGFRDSSPYPELLLNIYRILLTRIKKGIFIWFRDKETEEHFKEICL